MKKIILGAFIGIFILKASHTLHSYRYYTHRKVCVTKLNNYNYEPVEKCISELGPELKYLNVISYNLELYP